jgi:hypothetical protein
VFARQVREPDFFQEECFAAIVQVRRAGQDRGAHGWRTGLAVPVGGNPEAAVVGTTAVPDPVEGASVSGSVARPARDVAGGQEQGTFLAAGGHAGQQARRPAGGWPRER